MNATMTDDSPVLDATYQVTDKDVANYAKNGFARINNICSKEELEPYRDALKVIADDFRKTKAPLSERDIYGKAFLQITNIWPKSKFMQSFILAKRFGKIAADLMGVDGVRMYHDQALYKEASGGHTPWHQDQYYWPTDDHHTITMWMPMVDATRDMGLMEFVSDTNTKGMLSNIDISEASDRIFSEILQKESLPITTFDAIDAGSATFHSGWTLHRAGPNTTNKLREVMTIIFIADGIKVSNPKNKAQENDMKGFFPGLKPGDIANSPLNPLIYSRKK